MILNRTRKKPLCRKTSHARTPFQKLRGLMFRSRLDGGMLFSFRGEGFRDIWTFGMRFPIDIVWLDSRKRVVKIKEHARPFRFLGGCRARYVVELAAGTVRRTSTSLGDTVEFKA